MTGLLYFAAITAVGLLWVRVQRKEAKERRQEQNAQQEQLRSIETLLTAIHKDAAEIHALADLRRDAKRISDALNAGLDPLSSGEHASLDAIEQLIHRLAAGPTGETSDSTRDTS